MPHAHHFLSRLDRVSLPHVELALSLYNDPALLTYILAEARLPDGADRAAISLDDPERGPFLIVTRDGRFVTCLGDGMSTADLPVITRSRLDAIGAKGSDLRARMESCHKLAAQRGGVNKLLERIYTAGDELSREEFVAISALQPLYGREFLKLLFRTGTELDEARRTLLVHLRRSERLKPQFHALARNYWDAFWAIGHLSVLTSMGGLRALNMPPQLQEQVLSSSFSWGAVRQGVIGLALKGVWSAARIGKPALPGYKQRFMEANSHLSAIDAGMSLAALGMRHAKLGAEVQKALAAGPATDAAYVVKLAELLYSVVGLDFKTPSEVATLQRTVGAELMVGFGAKLAAGSPYRFTHVNDVPEDLAMTLAANVNVDFLQETNVLVPFFAFLPWVARAAPEQLYLPHDFIKAVRTPWRPELTYRLLRSVRDHYKETPATPTGPTRNGPCTCGSGKKYKRCCGEHAAAANG